MSLDTISVSKENLSLLAWLDKVKATCHQSWHGSAESGLYLNIINDKNPESPPVDVSPFVMTSGCLCIMLQ